MSSIRGGIAGFFGSGDETLLRALGEALHHRGSAQALHCGKGLGLVALGDTPEIALDERGAAVAAGADPRTVLAAYAESGAAALSAAPALTGAPALRGESALSGAAALTGEFALAIHAPATGTLVLARAGHAPLYYARYDAGVLFASEPAALLATGLLATAPDLRTVRRFVLTGRSDDGDATFFAGISQVPADTALVLRPDGMERVPLIPSARGGVPEAFAEAQRPAVRLGGGLPGAVLAASAPDASAVLSASFGPMDSSEDSYAEAVLPLLAAGVKHHPVPADGDTLAADLPALLRALGEPLAAAESYLQFVVAREAAVVGADVLVDPAGAAYAYDLPTPTRRARRTVDPRALVRIPGLDEETTGDGSHAWHRAADRFAARLGVRIEMPFLGRDGRPDDLLDALPPEARGVAAEPRPAAPTREWLLRLKNRVYGLFMEEAFVNRGWFDQQAVMVAFEDFIKGRNADAELFWRIWCVEMWAREFLDPRSVSAGEPPRRKGLLDPNPGKELEIAVDGTRWLRFPIRTDLFLEGAPYQQQIVEYVRGFVRAAVAEGSHAAAFERPWYVLVSEKVVAISQGRSYFIWDIEPSWWARLLNRFVVRTPYGIGLGSPWTMELAIREAGLPRVLVASAVGAVGKLVGVRGLFYRIAGPSVRAIDGPTEYSVFPANVSAKLGPAQPHRVAAELAAMLRTELAADGLTEAKTLAGVVVIDANDIGRNVLGLHADRPARFFEDLFGDNPLGQGSEQTPIAIATRAVNSRLTRDRSST